MSYKCPYCGVKCMTLEARDGHARLCLLNPVNLPATPAKKQVPEQEVAETTPGGDTSLTFSSGAHAGQTPEQVLPNDRGYIEWAASLCQDQALRTRCKELLAAAAK